MTKKVLKKHPLIQWITLSLFVMVVPLAVTWPIFIALDVFRLGLLGGIFAPILYFTMIATVATALLSIVYLLFYTKKGNRQDCKTALIALISVIIVLFLYSDAFSG